ncbi:F178B protein, partial [Nothocercus julius]|nr:F178B protein [Nothocercus julius]
MAASASAGGEPLRWYQIPLSSARAPPRTGLFSPRFQAGLQRYQQLRAHKQLRVGRPFTLPPPGLLEAAAAAVTAPPPPTPRRPREPPPTPRPRRHRRRRHRAGPKRADAPSRSVVSADGEAGEDVLGPLRELLLVGDDAVDSLASSPDPLANSLDPLANGADPAGSSADLLAYSPDPLANSPDPPGTHMDPLTIPLDPLATSLDSVATSPDLPGGHPAALANSLEVLLAEQRLFLARFAAKPELLPAVHPGEPVFCTRPPPAPTLDAHGLQPQSTLEQLFLQAPPARQAALVREGHLSLLYRCVPACPLPVLRWLFQVSATCRLCRAPTAPVTPLPPPRQMMAVCPDTANAAGALWDITVHQLRQPWCPTVPEISQAFCCLGADLGALHRQGLLPLELCPARNSRQACAWCSWWRFRGCCGAMRCPPHGLRRAQLLALCVVAQPGCYPDRARLALLTLLCFLALDRTLCCQPLPNLQLLLHCLLEGINDWQQQGAPPPPEPLHDGTAAGRATGHRAAWAGACRGGHNAGGAGGA